MAFFALFGIGTITYYVIFFKMYRYVKACGHVTEPPISPREILDFVSHCYALQKELKDKKLKNYVYALHLSLAFCVVVLLWHAI